jgi:hypothetical protein
MEQRKIMSRRTYYLFGRLNADSTPSVYDDSGDYPRVRLYFCDTPDDLPSGISEGDLAIVINNQKLYFADSAEEWQEVKGKKD